MASAYGFDTSTGGGKVAKSATLANNVALGTGSYVGHHVQVGQPDNDARVNLGAHCRIEDNATIGLGEAGSGELKETSVGHRASIGPSCVIGQGTRVGSGAAVGAGAVLGQDCVVRDGAVLPAGTRLAAARTIPPLHGTTASGTPLCAFQPF